MKKQLNTKTSFEHIHSLLYNSKEYLITVTSLKIIENIYHDLKHLDNNNVNGIIIFKNNFLSKEDIAFLNSLKHLNLLQNNKVGVNCFINEDEVLITSVNIFSPVERPSFNIGISITSSLYEDDLEESKDEIIEELKQLIHSSKKIKLSERSKSTELYSEVLKTEEDKLHDFAKELSKFYKKEFHLGSIINPIDSFVCKDFYEQINLIIWNNQTTHFVLKYKDSTIKKIKENLIFKNNNVINYSWHKTNIIVLEFNYISIPSIIDFNHLESEMNAYEQLHAEILIITHNLCEI